MFALIERTTQAGVAVLCAALLLASCDTPSVRASNLGPGPGPSPGPGPLGPSLGAAQTYGIVAGSTVTCRGPVGTVSADLGLWPGIAVTGFPTCTISGTSNMANALAQTAQGDVATAYAALTAMPCVRAVTMDLGVLTLTPGVWCSALDVRQPLNGTVTLDGAGNTNATFLIRIRDDLTVAGSVRLIGGAQAKNVWWQVGGSTTLGAGSAMQGNILALGGIELHDNATLLGRAFTRDGALTLGSNNRITLP